MVYIRKSVWASGGDFSDPTLYWYAKGVGAMKAKPLADPTSWRFMGAVHGIDLGLWQQYGYYKSGEALPAKSVQDAYWNQCQHQSWYFLPWHRGYVWSIESMLRAEIVKLGGPKDWAMPYWNYSDTQEPRARVLPPAFSRTTMPDGSQNPLYVVQRYGQGTTPIVLPPQDVTLQALNAPNYTGTGGGALSGFGGTKTAFSHSGSVNGQLESRPHNIIHVDIGGFTSAGAGLMSDPDTAGLDPIFWLHHCNIDRLWAVWNAQSASHTNPTDPVWLNGPLDRKFIVPTPTGEEYVFTPADMLDPAAAPLNYMYEGMGGAAAVAAAGGTAHVAMAAAPATPKVFGNPANEVDMAAQKDAELVGANNAALSVTGARAKTTVQMDQGLGKAVAFSLQKATKNAPMAATTAPAAAPSHDKVLLHLENIRAARDGLAIDVYVNLPDAASPGERPDLLAGTVGLFGVRKASLNDQPHGGMGVNEVFDITRIVAALEREGQWDGGSLNVDLVPRQEAREDAKITVERVSLYRQEP